MLKLRMALLVAGRPHNQVAREAGIDPTVFSKIVRGWRAPTPDQRRAIAETLGKPEHELFDQAEEAVSA